MKRKIENMISTASFKTQLGMVLILIGMPLATCLRNVFPSLELVNVFMVISVLSIFNFRNLFELKFPSFNKWFSIILLMQIIQLVYAMLAGKYDFLMYHFYIIAVIFAISTNNRNIKYGMFLRIAFYATGFISIVVLYQATFGFKQLVGGGYLGTSRLFLEEGGDPINLARVLTINIILIVVYNEKSIFENVVKKMFLISSIIGLFAFRTRGAMVVALLAVVLYYWNITAHRKEKSEFQRIKLFLYFSGTIFGVVFLYYNNVYFFQKIGDFGDSLVSGVSTYLSGNKSNTSVDPSTIVRYGTINKVFSSYSSVSWFNLFFGKGYHSMYIDVPLLQAFYDLGIFGFIYVFITMILPFKNNLYKTSYYNEFLFIKLICLQVIFDQLFNGLPYFYMQFTPIILLVFFKQNQPGRIKIFNKRT
jgi:hypothetical protein